MYFEIKYRGKSSEDFNAVVFTNNTDTHNSVLTRTVTKGVISDINLFPSYSYAVFNNDFSFNLQMFKKDNTFFSETEKKKINSWLTSCKYSSELEIIYKDCKGNEQNNIFYKGHFTDVTYEIGNGGIVILKTVFSPDTPYCAYLRITSCLSCSDVFSPFATLTNFSTNVSLKYMFSIAIVATTFLRSLVSFVFLIVILFIHYSSTLYTRTYFRSYYTSTSYLHH